MTQLRERGIIPGFFEEEVIVLAVDDRAAVFVEKMKSAGLPRRAIESFVYHLGNLFSGATGTLREAEILPIPALPDSETFEAARPAGENMLSRVAVIKLNGGLGTGMGLAGPKSLLRVRGDLCFLDLIARQILELRRTVDHPVPLILMNSYRTRQASIEVLGKYPKLRISGMALDFLQNRVPKIREADFHPAEFPSDPAMEWCPPGHGDLYAALGSSGILNDLMAAGIEYAFVSNADNLGAVLDSGILGYMVENDIDFLMEAADRTSSDRKGGHLCIRRGEGLSLRESAQCAPEERAAFQDIERYRYFNTNNLWIHLPSLAALMDHYGGVLPLTTIFNRKTVDPADPGSEAVIQLETAMGDAISLFPNSAAVRVPRSRFSPVKSTSDLLAVRSDAYEMTPDFRVVQAAGRIRPPRIDLDPAYYRMLDDFELRFPAGAPSLRNCQSMEIRGNVFFGALVRVDGDVRITAGEEAVRIEDGSKLSGSVHLQKPVEA